MRLSKEYFRQPDVLFLSRDLIGKFLMTNFNGVVTGGMIIETEAYRGPEDRASHAYGGRRTQRNAVMYLDGGICYVYRCYGIHSLLNIVTNVQEIPHAILIRAIEPSIGIQEMFKRRKISTPQKLTSGPGALSQALGITVQHNGLPLDGPEIWIEDRGILLDQEEIVAGPRIGIDYAGEDASLPWRYRLSEPSAARFRGNL